MVFLNGSAIPEPDRRGQRTLDDSFLVMFNAHHEPITFTLPDEEYGDRWIPEVDTAAREIDARSSSRVADPGGPPEHRRPAQSARAATSEPLRPPHRLDLPAPARSRADLRGRGGAGGHLARLGVSHLYLSPVLQASAGSTHGYDVVDHTRIAKGLGGEAASTISSGPHARRGSGLSSTSCPTT